MTGLASLLIVLAVYGVVEVATWWRRENARHRREVSDALSDPTPLPELIARIGARL